MAILLFFYCYYLNLFYFTNAKQVCSILKQGTVEPRESMEPAEPLQNAFSWILREWFAPTQLGSSWAWSPRNIWNLVLSACNFPAFWEHLKPFRHINRTSSERHNSTQKIVCLTQYLHWQTRITLNYAIELYCFWPHEVNFLSRNLPFCV